MTILNSGDTYAPSSAKSQLRLFLVSIGKITFSTKRKSIWLFDHQVLRYRNPLWAVYSLYFKQQQLVPLLRRQCLIRWDLYFNIISTFLFISMMKQLFLFETPKLVRHETICQNGILRQKIDFLLESTAAKPATPPLIFEFLSSGCLIDFQLLLYCTMFSLIAH